MSFLKSLNVGAIKETLATGVKTAQENLSSIDVKEVVHSTKDAVAAGVKDAQETITNIDVNEVAQSAKAAAANGANAISKTVKGITQKAPEDEEQEDLSLRKLIELLWCMAFADEVITEAERETLNELSSNIDANFEAYQAEIEEEFTQKLLVNSKEFGHITAVKIEVKGIIESLELTPQEAKLLCWNMLALASSDGLDDTELDLIRFIGEQSGLATSIIEELRNYCDAIAETASAREQLKQSARSYSEIEPLVNDLTKREQTLIEAAQALIADR